MQKRIYGVTEKFWESQTAAFKLYWNLGNKTASLLLGFFIVTKTGFSWFDNLVALATGSVAILVTAGQRDFSKYPRALRRRVTRYSVGWTLKGTTILGVCLFLSILVPLVTGVVRSLPSFADAPISPSIEALSKIYPSADAATILRIEHVLIYGIVLYAVFRASLNAFRGMQFEEMIHKAPKRGLIKYLVRRERIVTDLPSLVQFEVTVLMFSVMFSSAVVMLAQIALGMPIGG